MKYLLATSTVVGLLRGDTGIHSKLVSQDRVDIVVPNSALAEVQYALARAPKTSARERLSRRLKIFTEEFQIGTWSTETNRAYGRIRAELESRGLTPRDFEVSEAAMAVSLGACLVTCQPDPMTGVRGLRVADWSAA